MFLLRAEERDARIVSMCQLKEHTVNNVILTKYECVCGNIVNVHIYSYALNKARPLHRQSSKVVLDAASWHWHFYNTHNVM